MDFAQGDSALFPAGAKLCHHSKSRFKNPSSKSPFAKADGNSPPCATIYCFLWPIQT
jgi:hypothetical protein